MRMAGLWWVLAIVAAATGGASVEAADIYRWVDAEGVVHFSDEAPEDRVVETLVVRDSTPAGYDPHDDPYSILNQARRTGAAWGRLEKAREERRAERQAQSERVPVYDRRPGFDSRFLSFRAPLFFPPGLPGQGPRHRPGQQRRVLRSQQSALEETALTGPRAASINSGPHRERVQRSQALPLAGGKR